MMIRKLVAISTVLVFVVGVVFPGNAFGLSIKKEKELSEEFMETARKHFVFIRDPLIADYVSELGQKILSVMPPQPFDYKFYVVRDDSYNAFAGPAGVIFVHSGLLASMESEEELAGLLSHEIAHVSNRHIARGMSRSKTIGLATLGAMVAGILVGMAGVPAEAVVIGALSGAQSLSLSYSREDEMEADKSGLKYLREAGYTGEGLLAMLRRMRTQQWFGPNEIPTYLMTHPALEERMVYLASRVGDTGPPAEKPEPLDESRFHWANTKINAMYGEEKAVLRRFKARVEKHPESSLAHYGYGLILARTGSRKDAIHHFKLALERRAFDPSILADLGRAHFQDGQYEQALSILSGAASIAPDNPYVRFFLGRAQIELGMFPEAQSNFEWITRQHDDVLQAFYYLGDAYGKEGKLGKAHLTLSEYYKRRGDRKNALFHLERALENTQDPEEKRKIEEMLNQAKGKGKEDQEEREENEKPKTKGTPYETL